MILGETTTELDPCYELKNNSHQQMNGSHVYMPYYHGDCMITRKSIPSEQTKNKFSSIGQKKIIFTKFFHSIHQ